MNRHRARLRTVHLGAILLAVTAAGCTRSQYRQQADADAYCLTDQKAAVLDAPFEEFRIEVDPRSRMFDPFDPDCEPMPPDDPLSNRYLQCVDCKKGSKCWRCLPKTPFVENPAWHEYLPRNADGSVPLDLRDAVEVALLHSPRYQNELEDLYLSALDVSFERFRFDTQFFGGSEIFFTADGRDRTGTGNSSSFFEVTPSRTGSRLRAERLTATGGELVVGMANSLMWQFAGPDDYSSNTILDFSLVQPLLRRAGRTRVLERLTIAERTLLANVRQMERFRRGFYLSVVTGGDAGPGPSRRGGFFGGSGLEGFSGVGGGGFGAVGAFGFGGGFGGGGGGGFTGGAGAQGAGGYLGLLQDAQQIRNQRANVIALRESVEQLQASYEAGRIDRFQVDLAQQALFNAQSQLLTSENVYLSSIENFKVDFGLPPELPIELTDPILDRFNLIDPNLEAVQRDVADALQMVRRQRELLQADPAEANAALADDQAEETAEEATRVLDPFDWPVLRDVLREAVEVQLQAVRVDLDAVDQARPARGQMLSRLRDRDEVRDARIDDSLFDAAVLDQRIVERRTEFANLEQRVAKIWAALDALDAEDGTFDDAQLDLAVDQLTDLSGALLEMSLVQAGARLESIAFEPVALTPQQALRIAAAYRRDWANARAQLVDTWRLIFFNANDLLSDLDIIFSGDIGNVSDNPFDLRDSRGRLRVGLRFDAPLTRLGERNIYRQSLIEYQQARRSYYQFRDRVYQGLRNTLRQLRLNEVNFELRRAAVLVAISQVDLTQLRLSEPPKPGEEAQLGNTTARDLVQSLSDLLNVQNDFLSVWVNYEVQRLNLDFSLGVMELDATGNRLENPIPYSDYLTDAACPPLQNQPGSNIQLELPESVAPPAETLPAPSGQGDDAADGATEPLLRQPDGAVILTTYELPALTPLPPVANDAQPPGGYNEP